VDLATASQLFDRGCALGETDSCRALGRLYEGESHTLAERDVNAEGDAFLASPVSLYEAECAQGEIGACEVLGDFFHFGVAGTPVDEVKSKVYYHRACSGGSTTACKKEKGALPQWDAVTGPSPV